jgi:hypothetical protein
MPVTNNGVLDGIRRIGAKVRDLTIDGGLPGAPQGLRIRGATTAGAPTTGTWKARDVIEDGTGTLWLCTAAGTPGTWQALSVQGSEAPGGVSVGGMGFALASLPFSLINSEAATLTNEDLICTLATAAVTKTITKLGIALYTAGVTAGSGVNVMAIFSESGSTQLGYTSDMTAAMEGTGDVEGTLASGVAVTAGTNYWVCALSSFTTAPVAYGFTAASQPAVAINGHYPGSRYTTSQATLPGSISPSGYTRAGVTYYVWGR